MGSSFPGAEFFHQIEKPRAAEAGIDVGVEDVEEEIVEGEGKLASVQFFRKRKRRNARSVGECCLVTEGELMRLWTMARRYDHIDLRVPDLGDGAVLPALGLTRRVEVEGWLQYESGEGGAYFGVTESPGHVANENRIAFWAESADEVARLAETVVRAGARNVEGPMLYEPGYHAVFFEDPAGNRLEVCWREVGAA